MNNKILNIVFEDSNIIALNKPAGISVVGQEETLKDTLVMCAKQYLNVAEVFPLTSLDAQATGIVIFAKNKSSYNFIAEQFKNESVVRIYHIIVNGIMENEIGEINKNLIVSEQNTSVSEKGLQAVTKYIVKEQFKSFAFVEVNPITSRKNQIRAHFWSIGNPLAIDKIYASEEPILLSSLKKRYKGISKEKPLLQRLPMHLSKVELMLPDASNKISFETALPDDIEITLKQFRKYNKRGIYYGG